MPGALRHLKNMRSAHRLLNALLLREIRRAERTGNSEPLGRRPALYAVERRVLDYLAGLGFGQPLAASAAPSVVLTGFDLLRDAMVCLRDTARVHAEARHWNARLNALEREARVERVRSYPLRGHVELTNRCNMRCPICPQSWIPESIKRTTMSRESLDAVLPYLKWMEDVRLFGFGESLLAEYFADLLRAVPPQVRSMLITNGLLLTPENVRLLVDGGLKTLCVSVDGAKRETYLRMRGMDALEQVLANVASVTAYRRERKSATPQVCINFAATRSNITELGDFIRRAHALGVDEVGIGYLLAFTEEFRRDSLFYDQDRSDRLMAAAEQTGREVGIQVWTPPRFASSRDTEAGGPSDKPTRECHEPWKSVSFRSDGHLAPCGSSGAKYALWPASDLFEAWNSAPFVRLRQTQHTAGQPERCRQCLNVFSCDMLKEHYHLAVATFAAEA
jgi:MoaA/NifB/PqqE/SkfB family radical SAM enzyme